MYDVYYTTGGGPWVNAGTDLWVNDFLENVVPHLKVRPVLLIHRTKPKGFEDFEFPIETHWQGDNVGEFRRSADQSGLCVFLQFPLVTYSSHPSRLLLNVHSPAPSVRNQSYLEAWPRRGIVWSLQRSWCTFFYFFIFYFLVVEVANNELVRT